MPESTKACAPTPKFPTPRFEVTAFGETMLRLSVPSGERFTKMRRLDVSAGGAESNVLGALSSLGRRCAWHSAVPDTDLGQFILRELAAAGIQARATLKKGRVGSYYVEFASAPRAVQVIYDRADSAVSTLTPNDIDWDELLDTRILHLTGITAALSEGCYEIVLKACKRAKEKGVTVSFDVNYRSKLWSAELARERLEPLLTHLDILICGAADAQSVFGLTGTPKALLKQLGKVTSAAHIVLTRAHEGAATLQNGVLTKVAATPAAVVDRLGAGDAFAAGLLDGFLEGDLLAGMRRGCVLASLALAQHGDLLSTSRVELEALLGKTQGRLVR